MRTLQVAYPSSASAEELRLLDAGTTRQYRQRQAPGPEWDETMLIVSRVAVQEVARRERGGVGGAHQQRLRCS